MSTASQLEIDETQLHDLTDGWRLNAMASGTEPTRATLLFDRRASKAVAHVNLTSADEAADAIKRFLATDTAALRYAALCERLAKATAEYNSVVAELHQAKARFVADESAAGELDGIARKEAGLRSRVDALQKAIGPAREAARQSYMRFQTECDSRRLEQLHADCRRLTEMIEALVAPLLSDFGAARDALRSDSHIPWPDFDRIQPALPARNANDPPPQAFDLTTQPPILHDNRFHMPPVDRPADPNWGRERPPIRPMMVPVDQADASE